MAESSLFDRLLRARPRESQVDLIAVTIVTLVAVIVVLAPPFDGGILQFGVGVLFVFFVPGYALISALFPGAPTAAATDEPDAASTGILPGRLQKKSGIDGVDRAALAFATSLAVVPLIGIALSITPWGPGLVSTVAGLAGVTLCAVAVGWHRRGQLPEAQRFVVPYQSWLASGRTRLFSADSRVDAVLTIVLAVSVLLAFGSVALAVASPPDGEQYSEFYILTEGPDEELVADRYPTDLVAGEPEPIVVGVENYEQRATEYTVVVEIQAVEQLDDNRLRVVDRERVETFEPTLEDGESWQTEHDLVATMTGTELRVSYLLYTDEPPAAPSTETADQSLHLWVDVEESGDDSD